MEQLGSHWKDFHEILYMLISRKYTEEIQVSFKSDKHNECFTWRTVYIYDGIIMNYFYNEKVLEKPVEKIKTHILCSLTYFLKTVPFMK